MKRIRPEEERGEPTGGYPSARNAGAAGTSSAAHIRYPARAAARPRSGDRAGHGPGAHSADAQSVADAALATAGQTWLCPAAPAPIAAAPVRHVPQRTASASHPGHGESLGRAGAAALSGQEVQAGMLGARRALATLDPDSADYRATRHNLTVLQWQAGQRGLDERGPVPASHGYPGPGGLVLFADPVHCRYLLEQLIATSGLDGARQFIDEFSAMAADDEVPAGPSGDSDRRVVIAQL
ncbi:MAG: hypothetical protein AAGC55_11230, partial [Myxococcota bacterium]